MCHVFFSPVSLSVFSLIPDLLFDCSRVLEYDKINDKIRTVLQSVLQSNSIPASILATALIFKQKRLTFGSQTKVCF